MKTNTLLLILALCIAPTMLLANNGFGKGKYTKEKRITKEYDVNANALLKIDNSYGNVNIVSWGENRVVIEVTVKTNGNNEEKVQQKLDEIDISFNGSSSSVSAKTIFNRGKSGSWWSKWRNSSNVHMEINYEIKVPISNSVDLSNDYGGISLNKIEGNATINCDYGKLTIGELLGNSNNLTFDYTNNSTIEFMANGEIDADYSSFILERGGNIDLNADYSKSEFGSIENLIYNCDYGSLRTASSKDIRGDGDYLSAKFGTIDGNLELNADYGSIRIEALSPSAGNVTIEGDYTGIKIGYHPDYDFTFNITLSYSGLSGKDDLEFIKQRVKSSEKYYEGYYKNASSSNTVLINSDYGGVSLTKY